MTTVVVPSESTLNEVYGNKFPQDSQYVTDKITFANLFLCLALYCLITMSSAPSESEMNNWGNATDENYSEKSSSTAFSLIDSTLRTWNDDKELLNDSHIGMVVELANVLYFLGVFFLIKRIIVDKFFEISRKISDTEYLHHSAIVNVSRSIILMFFYGILYVQWTDGPRRFMCLILICIVLEVLMLDVYFVMYLEIWRYTRSHQIHRTSFKSVLRFFSARRNFMFFQFLNLMAMLLLTAGILASTIFLWEDNQIMYRIGMVASFFVIIFMNIYGEMVIILASASHNWEENNGVFRLKSILSPMITIARYHLGKIHSYFPLLNIAYQAGPRRPTKEEAHAPRDPTCLVECAKMLTTVYRQDTIKTREILHHPSMDSWINRNFKSITFTAWADMIIYSTSNIFILSTVWFPISDQDELLSLIVVFTFYVVINGIYYYVFIKPINVIQSTIEFCKNVETQDSEVTEEKQPESDSKLYDV